MIAVTWSHFTYSKSHAGNLGDRAVSLGTLALLRRVTDEDIVFVHPMGQPPRLSEVEVVRKVPNGAKVVYGGGEHLFTQPDLSWRLAPVLLADVGIVLPSTFGPFSPQDRSFISGLRYPVSARDPRSAALMTDILGRDVPLLGDPALFLDTGPVLDGDRVLFVPRREDAGLRLGTFRPKAGPRSTEAFRRYRAAITGVGDRALLVAQVYSDLPLVEALARATGVEWVRPTTLPDLLELYRTCGRVVTSRYHSALFAAMHQKHCEVIAWPAHGHKFGGVPADVPRAKADTLAWVRAHLPR